MGWCLSTNVFRETGAFSNPAFLPGEGINKHFKKKVHAQGRTKSATGSQVDKKGQGVLGISDTEQSMMASDSSIHSQR